MTIVIVIFHRSTCDPVFQILTKYIDIKCNILTPQITLMSTTWLRNKLIVSQNQGRGVVSNICIVI